MTYQDLGYTDQLEHHRIEQQLDTFQIGRIILEHKERYVIKTPEQEFDAELMGNLRYSAESRYDLPAVGDWVAFVEYDVGKALIQAIYPRHSIIERKAVAKSGQVQIIATNIDVGFIVQAVGRDMNLNRLERYLTICHASDVSPVIVLSKVDLVDADEMQDIIQQIRNRISEVPIIPVSSESIGYSQIEAFIEAGKTYCLLGSSGVGKSTLLNGLIGQEQMKTSAISDAVGKGRHTTSHRELIVLPQGGILIDNPGMREVGIADTADGLEMTFESILAYSEACKFKDCSHIQEKGCAILAAVEQGEISQEAYDNFMKMEREKWRFEADIRERRQKDRATGKLYKRIQEERRKNKY